MSQFNLKVHKDRVLIKPDPVKHQGANKDVLEALENGKLVLPDKYEAFYKNLPDTGVVVGIGDQCDREIKIGDRVHFGKLSAAKVQYNNEEFLIVRDYDVDFTYA